MILSFRKKIGLLSALLLLAAVCVINPFRSQADQGNGVDGVRFEFEQAKVVNASGKTIPNSRVADSYASGGYYEGVTGNKGYIFTDVPLSNRVWIGYASGFTSFVTVYLEIEGEFEEIGQINFSKTEGWNMDTQWVVGSGMLSIPEGSTVKLVPTVDVNLDYAMFSATPWYEESDLETHRALAKNGLLQQAKIQDDLLAYVGKSVLLEKRGSSVTLTVPSAGAVFNVVNVRYKTAADLSVSLSVNGEKVLTAMLPATYKETYDEIGLRISDYQAGDTVTVALEKEDSLWLDSLAFSFFRDAENVYIPKLSQQVNERTEISLDGIWQCDSGPFDRYADLPDTVPESLRFDNSIPVPGMWDQASVSMGHYDRKALWYKKVVVLEEEPASQVILKINRAYYGRYVYVNGTLAGEYQYSYTNSYMDIGKYLRKGENEIVVMLGGYLQQLNDPQCIAHVGNDGERIHNYPGIVDSVSLLFYQTPSVQSVQTAADLANGKTIVQAVLQNVSDFPVTTDVIFRIYELGVFADGKAQQERKLVGTHTVSDITVAPSGSTTLDVVEILLEDFSSAKYWTPDNPYLYQIEVRTSGDRYTSRFGMRTFYFDPDTKLPMLNGKVHYLRGTNLAVNRFYDDPSRQEYPWQETWVRQLYQEIKETNWDCFRIHMGSAPAFWYDLADEMGLLVMDEYAWWSCSCGCTVDSLRPEITAWMDEKCNHPSIIIWDMQNEDTKSEVTGQVIQAMRGYDIQNRPWDNGWAKPQSETDSFECHPYFLSHLTFLRDLNNHSPFYENPTSHIPENFAPNNPKINNEYTNIWINREGDPATTAYVQYYDIVTPGGTGADRIAHYGMATGQLSEFWRSGRHFAGLMQFAALIYSKPTDQGATGDILMPDISVPQFHPEIKESYRNAFAPLGVIIGDWSDTCVRGESRELPIILVNDTNDNIEGLPVTLRIYKGDRSKVVYEKKLTFDIKEAGDPQGGDLVKQVVSLKVPAYDTDRYLVVAEYTRNGETVYSQRMWQITGGEINEPGLGTAAFVGILTGGVVLAAGGTGLGLYLRRKKRRQSRNENASL